MTNNKVFLKTMWSK